MKTIHISTLALAGVVLATGVFAQTQAHVHDRSAQNPALVSKQTSKAATMDDKMMAQCKEMMQKKEQMQADFKEQDAKVDDLVTKMNTSTGADRVEAMAAVVTELSVQRKVRQEKMTAMQADLMQHMMEHMQMGKQSMSMCPMMNAMKMPATGSSQPDDHSKHHQSK